MSRSLRLSVLLLALFLTVLCRPVEAQRPPRQPAQTKPDPADLGGITLVTQKTPFVSHLSAARRAIEEKDWPVATTLLQKLLDLPADLTVLVTQKGPGDKETKRFVGLRSEAEQLVGTLPAAGRAFYQLEYGLKAAELLKEARFFDEPALFAEVVRRYLHTAAGFEATERLATHQLDRGHSLSAALYFEKLIQSTGPEKFSALTLFKATLAFRGMGDRNRADLCWKHLKKKVGKDGLELGKRKLKIDELRKELDRRSKPSASSGRPDWAMFRGDASRSARAAGTAFLLDPTWSQRTSEEKTTQEYLEKATRALRSQHRPVLSSFHPIAATRRENTSEIPLVIYCDYWGVHARVARKVKLSEDENYEAGDVYWEAPSTWSVDRMLNNSQHVGAIKQWMQMYQGGNVKPEIILENSVTGSLSTDNVRVYMVEDFTIPPYIQNHPFGRPGNRSGFEEN